MYLRKLKLLKSLFVLAYLRMKFLDEVLINYVQIVEVSLEYFHQLSAFLNAND